MLPERGPSKIPGKPSVKQKAETVSYVDARVITTKLWFSSLKREIYMQINICDEKCRKLDRSIYQGIINETHKQWCKGRAVVRRRVSWQHEVMIQLFKIRDLHADQHSRQEMSANWTQADIS